MNPRPKTRPAAPKPPACPLVQSLKNGRRQPPPKPPSNIYRLRVELMGRFSLEPHYHLIDVKVSAPMDLEVALQMFKAYFQASEKCQRSKKDLLPLLQAAANAVSHQYEAASIWVQLVGYDTKAADNTFCRPVSLKLSKFDKRGLAQTMILPSTLQPRKKNADSVSGRRRVPSQDRAAADDVRRRPNRARGDRALAS